MLMGFDLLRRKFRQPMLVFRGSHAEALRIPAEELLGHLSRYVGPIEDTVANRDAIVKMKHSVVVRLNRLRRSTRNKPSERLMLVSSPIGLLNLKLRYEPKKREYSVHSHPAVHSITAGGDVDSFERLKRVVLEGFVGSRAPNVFLPLHASEPQKFYSPSKLAHIAGDRYHIEVVAPLRPYRGQYSGVGFIPRATPEQIGTVYVVLSSGLTSEQIAERKRFYRQELGRKPLVFLKSTG